jgi:hypothetical protein
MKLSSSSDLPAQHLHPYLGPLVFIMFADRAQQRELPADRQTDRRWVLVMNPKPSVDLHVQMLNLTSLLFESFEEESSSTENLQMLKILSPLT